MTSLVIWSEVWVETFPCPCQDQASKASYGADDARPGPMKCPTPMTLDLCLIDLLPCGRQTTGDNGENPIGHVNLLVLTCSQGSMKRRRKKQEDDQRHRTI